MEIKCLGEENFSIFHKSGGGAYSDCVHTSRLRKHSHISRFTCCESVLTRVTLCYEIMILTLCDRNSAGPRGSQSQVVKGTLEPPARPEPEHKCPQRLSPSLIFVSLVPDLVFPLVRKWLLPSASSELPNFTSLSLRMPTRSVEGPREGGAWVTCSPLWPALQ